MKIKSSFGLFLTLLAIAFTIGLTFVSVELPRVVDSFLNQNFDSLDVATGSGAESEYKTSLYFKHYHLRLIGYGCLGLILILIIIGFVTEKSGFASAGAIFFFLPAFGHFALTMFFLGGLGFMRLIWIPLLDISFDVLRLGDIVYLLYRILLSLSDLIGISISKELPYAITSVGLLFFMLGTLAWFYARIQKKGIADFWIYRISRHPQYLGWIIWSYGIMFLHGPNIKKMFEISNSLPWLLMTMVIIGVAMLEELKMRKEQGKEYEFYRSQTPFLFPLPRIISKIFSFPLKLIFKKDFPERKREILAVVSFYTVCCMVISAFYAELIPLQKETQINIKQQIAKHESMIKKTKHRGDMRKSARKLAEIGEPAVETLIELLKNENLYVRWYTANVIGDIESDRIVQPLINLLDDKDRNVRRSAAGSLGRTGSYEAVQPLIVAMQDQTKDISIAAARALGQIGAQEAINPLIEALQETNIGIAGAAAEALGKIGDRTAISHLINRFEEIENCPHHDIGWALWKLGSERAVDVFIAGLNQGTWWRRSANATALGKMKSEKAIEPLIESLNDESERIRRAAVLALGEIKSKKAIDALTQALNDEDFEVRMYAKDALKKIKETGN